MNLRQRKRLALICGRYEGLDERVRAQLATDEISLGDYVLSGGEIAAMVVVDAVTRLIPGVLGYELSADQDSHSTGFRRAAGRAAIYPAPHISRCIRARCVAKRSPRQC